MMAPTDLLSSAAPALARASLGGALLALAALGLGRLWPALPASARAWLWWLVSLKLLVALLPLPAIALPVLPAAAGAWAEDHAAAPLPSSTLASRAEPMVASLGGLSSLAVVPAGGDAGPGATPGVGAIEPPPRTPRGLFALAPTLGTRSWWGVVVLALWAGGVLLQTLWLCRHLIRWRALVRRASPAPVPLQALAEELANRLGLARCPPVRISAETRVPQVGGALWPVVLLPASTVAKLSGDKLAMALCHELAHVRRRDLWFGWVPALAERIFFFNPVAWLASREYSLAREAACDQLALDTLDAEPGDYGRLLLQLGVGGSGSRLVAAGTSPTARLLKRRLLMLGQATSSSRRPLVALALVAASACTPVNVQRRAAATPPAPPPVCPPSAPEADGPDDDRHDDEADHDGFVHDDDEADRDDRPDDDDDDGRAKTPQSDRRKGRERPQERERSKGGERAQGREQPQGRERGAPGSSRAAWVFFEKPDASSVTMSGSARDIEAARRARGEKKGPMVYVRRGGKAYVVTDAATLEAARKLMASPGEFERKREALDAQQEKLAERQGEIERKQEEIESKHEALSERAAERETDRQIEEADHEAERGRPPGDAGDRARRRREREEVREVARLESAGHEREVRELSRRQQELARELAVLGEQQAAIGREQARVGQQEREADERMERELNALFDRAIAAGAASPAR
jgi:beta-lactamase regulating signal transducer with metallopeptidase domain